MNILELIEESHSLSLRKGFWDEKRNNSEIVLLIIANVGDIVKSHRQNRFADWISYDANVSILSGDLVGRPEFKIFFEKYLKDTFEDEMANVIIRICDFLGGNKTDILTTHPWMREYSEIPINAFLRHAQITKKYPGNISDWLHEALWECSYYSKENDCGLTHLMCYIGNIVCEMEIDIERHILAKLMYNETRPRLYGKMR
jgi:hypothetical protein